MTIVLIIFFLLEIQFYYFRFIIGFNCFYIKNHLSKTFLTHIFNIINTLKKKTKYMTFERKTFAYLLVTYNFYTSGLLKYSEIVFLLLEINFYLSYYRLLVKKALQSINTAV